MFLNVAKSGQTSLTYEQQGLQITLKPHNKQKSLRTGGHLFNERTFLIQGSSLLSPG